ncbi:MAG TPA: hypothetical protein PK874_10020 [Desulfobacteraceae bacterium]|nr:hypothetical protein [Desulfobacteraceae bacterium]
MHRSPDGSSFNILRKKEEINSGIQEVYGGITFGNKLQVLVQLVKFWAGRSATHLRSRTELDMVRIPGSGDPARAVKIELKKPTETLKKSTKDYTYDHRKKRGMEEV